MIRPSRSALRSALNQISEYCPPPSFSLSLSLSEPPPAPSLQKHFRTKQRMGVAIWSCGGAAVFASALLPGRRSHGSRLAPTELPFASASSCPLPFLSGPAVPFSPAPMPSSRAQLRLLRLRVQASAGVVLQDAAATTFCFAGAYSLVLVFDTLAERNIIQKVASFYPIPQEHVDKTLCSSLRFSLECFYELKRW